MNGNIGVLRNFRYFCAGHTRGARYFRLRRHESRKRVLPLYPRSPLTKLVPSPPRALRCDLFLICNHHAATTDRYPLYHPTGTLHGLCAYLLPSHSLASSLTHTGVHTDCRGFRLPRTDAPVRRVCSEHMLWY